MHRFAKSITFKLSALATGMVLSGMALAEAQISADLASKLGTALPTDELAVIVSYDKSGPINVLSHSCTAMRGSLSFRPLSVDINCDIPGIASGISQ